MNRTSGLKHIFMMSCFATVVLLATGCQKKAAAPAGAGMQAMPVQHTKVAFSDVPQSNDYVATIKSRRSATLQPQVGGQLTQIRVHSGDHVHAGQAIMEIDQRLQLASVASQKATERQKKATYDYDTLEQDRQKKLFEAGVTSREVYDQAINAYENAKADYESAIELRKTQEEQLAYYTIRAPFNGVIGDIPVHVGDYVSPQTAVLTTVDENTNLEAYIYVPTERAGSIKQGLAVELSDNSGKLLETTRVNFTAAQVDSMLQGILVKAPVHATPEILRNAQMIKAKVIWGSKRMAVIPVLAVTRQGGQSFVFVAKHDNGHVTAEQRAVQLGDMVGNSYSVTSGLNEGEQVITSSTQYLINGMPVQLLGA